MVDGSEGQRRPRRPATMGPEEILAAIRRWHDRYGEPPTMADWDPYRARRIGQEWRVARYDAGSWPSTKTVRNCFGRLSDAVAAAGLVPRRQGQARPRAEIALGPEIQLHLAHLRVQRDGPATPHVLVESIREVSRAQASNDPDDLRIALIDLAATALAWATSAGDRQSDSEGSA